MRKIGKILKEKLKEHSTHHTKKHMVLMRKFIKKGMSFNMAHKKSDSLIENKKY